MKIELENRLIDFSINIIELSKKINNNYAGQHLHNQIVRSGTSPALNYGEAQGAISKKDFIHKISLVLRELRETHINLRILNRSNLINKKSNIDELIKENNELIAIFHKTYHTSLSNLQKK